MEAKSAQVHLSGLVAAGVGNDTAGPSIDLSVSIGHVAFGEARTRPGIS
jgi:hypothetical protein